jgi:hypothetical protein
LSLELFGLCGKLGDVNRFAARYRAAKCFRKVDFETLTKDTADGYGALCHLLLTYSAFEFFLRAIDTELKATSRLLSDEERSTIQDRLRALPGHALVLGAVRAHVEARFQRQIDGHLQGLPSNPFYLAASLRHSFAHGLLTATPEGVPSGAVAATSRYLVRVLFRVVDREFAQRMTDFEKMLGGE